MAQWKVTIPKWRSFNPRSDRANYSWFRLENKFFKSTFALSDSAKLTYLYVLCEASQKNSDSIDVDIDLAAAMLRRSSKQVLKDIQLLSSGGFVTAESRHDDGIEPALVPATIRDVTRRNETNTHDDSIGADAPERVPLDFEEVYREYPRKEGKAAGLASCRSQIKSLGDLEKLRSAIRRYREHCEREGTEKRYIKHFSSFVQGGKWRDWLEPETGTGPTNNGTDQNYWNQVFAEERGRDH